MFIIEWYTIQYNYGIGMNDKIKKIGVYTYILINSIDWE